jgi:DNA-binding response OmpR family regulator
VLYPLSYEGGGLSLGHCAVAYDRRVSEGTVLVVDDDAVILELLKVNFEIEGYEVVTAASGTHALQRSHQAVPDVVVLDVVMPGIDGLEVARRLREDPATAGVSILLLSGKARHADIDAGRRLADDYMTKPFDAMDLLARVSLLLTRRGVVTESDRAGGAGPGLRSQEA